MSTNGDHTAIVEPATEPQQTEQPGKGNSSTPKLGDQEELRHQVEQAVNAQIEIWREARLKEISPGFITVAEEFEKRKHLYEVEAAKRGLPLHPQRQRNAEPVQTLKVFFQREIPAKEPLIEGLLYRRDIVGFAGRRRHGKTTLMGNLALALTLPHSDFLEYSIPNPARVLSFFFEDDAGELQVKLKRMSKERIPQERLALYTREDFYKANVPIDVRLPQFRDFVLGTCASHRPDAITLDNLAHLVGGDYNNSKLIHELNRFIWELTNQFNAAVIIAAHPRKRDKRTDAFGGSYTARLRDNPEEFFEEVMGSSHFVNSCGSLWGIERDLGSERTDFLGGTQRFNGQQSLMALEKDDDDWLRRVSDFDMNLKLALNTERRKKAWELLPQTPFSYTEAEKVVKPAIKSASTFYEWFQLCRRLGVIVPEGNDYRKATANPENNRSKN